MPHLPFLVFMKKIKKIILSILTLACVSGIGAGIAYAQQNETYGMKTDHDYLVPIKAWGKNSEVGKNVCEIKKRIWI